MATLGLTEADYTEHPPVETCAPSSGTAFASAARTATPEPVIYAVPEDTQNLLVVIDATASAATPSVVFTIEGVDRASGKTWVILTSAAITGAGTTILRVSPNLTAAANTIAQDMVPAEIVIRPTHGDADSLTYSVGVHFTA